MSEVASAYVSLIPSYKGGTRAISKQLSGPADEAGKESGKRFSGGFLSTAKYVAAGAAIYKGLSGAATFAKGAIFDFNSQIQNSTVAFTTMLGSGTKAQSLIKDLQSFAKSTPFDFPGLVTASQKLLAFGFKAKDIIPTLTSIGDASAGLGLGAEGVDRLTTAIGQISAKGKVQSDELLQLTEAGVPALKILANGFGVGTAAMQKMITKGLVPANKAIPLLLGGIEKGTTGAAGATAKFGGLMDKQSHTFSGALANIKDSLQQTIAQAALPLFNAASVGLQKLSGVMSGFGGVVQSVTGFLRAHKVIVTALAVAIGVAVAVWGVWTLAVKTFTAVQAAFNAVMAVNPIVLVTVAVLALAAGLIYAYKHSETFRNVVKSAFTVVKAVVMPVINLFRVQFAATAAVFRAVGNAASSFASGVVGAFNTVKRFVGNIVHAVASIPSEIGKLGGKMLSAGGKLMSNLFDGIKHALAGVGGFAADIGKSVVNGIIDALNFALRLPLKLPHVHIKGTPITVGGQTLVPKIPKLAKGGIVPATPGGQLVRVAEAGHAEAVIPLDGKHGLPGGAPLVGVMNISQLDDPRATAASVGRRLEMLGKV